MTNSAMGPARAGLEQAILNAEAESVASSDLYAWLIESGLPSEIAIRLKSLTDFIMKVGDKIVHVGKIILIKIVEFVKNHPNLAVGMAAGAAIAALVGAVPLLGPALMPIAMAMGAAIGALAGHRMDMNRDLGEFGIARDVIEIAKAFFKLLIDTFNTTLNKQALSGA